MPVNSKYFQKLTVKLQHFFDVLSRIGQGSSKILAIKLARASSMQCYNKNFQSRRLTARLQISPQFISAVADLPTVYKRVTSPCSEDDQSAALSNNGCTKFVDFTILLEKPIACQSVVFSCTEDPQLQFLATGLFMFYNYTSFWL